jgi:hypothetical protein
MQISETYDNPFREKSNSGGKKESKKKEGEKTQLIVDAYRANQRGFEFENIHAKLHPNIRKIHKFEFELFSIYFPSCTLPLIPFNFVKGRELNKSFGNVECSMQ